ncbi:MAG: protease modulator HflC [Chthoniobacterales bacterium]
MKRPLLIRATVSILVLIILFSFMIGFQVRQNEQVVLTRFGSPVRVIKQPGLYAKWPWPLEKVNRFDARLNFYEIRLSEALTKDKRNVIVPVFVAWRIVSPQKFLEAMGSTENARNKLDSLVSSAKNTVLGSFDFNQLVSIKPEDVKLPEIEGKIARLTSEQALNSFGIAIEQVGIERVTLPEVNTRYVFERMRAERAQFAERYRAEGKQEADAINAQTDAEKTVLLAEARKSAEETRGKAEAEVARIYSAAHQEQPDLYRFLREIETLKKVVNQNTTLVLDANSPPFDLLKAVPAQSGSANPRP